MRFAGRMAVAGVVVVLAAACSDDARNTTSTVASTPGSTTAVAAMAATTTTTLAATTTSVPPTTSPPRVAFSDDASAIAGVTATFTYDGSPIGPDDAQCIGNGLVHVFGPAKVGQLGFGIGRWTLLGFSIALGPWDRADATAVVDTFRVCSPDWELLMITSVTSTAERLDATASRCVAAALADTRAREIFITLLDRPDDGTVGAALADLEQAYASCLTPSEVRGLGLE